MVHISVTNSQVWVLNLSIWYKYQSQTWLSLGIWVYVTYISHKLSSLSLEFEYMVHISVTNLRVWALEFEYMLHVSVTNSHVWVLNLSIWYIYQSQTLKFESRIWVYGTCISHKLSCLSLEFEYMVHVSVTNSHVWVSNLSIWYIYISVANSQVWVLEFEYMVHISVKLSCLSLEFEYMVYISVANSQVWVLEFEYMVHISVTNSQVWVLNLSIWHIYQSQTLKFESWIWVYGIYISRILSSLSLGIWVWYIYQSQTLKFEPWNLSIWYIYQSQTLKFKSWIWVYGIYISRKLSSLSLGMWV